MISESKSESDGHLVPLDVDGPWTGRGTAAAATWIFRGGPGCATTWRTGKANALMALECWRRHRRRAAEYPRGSHGGAATRPRTIRFQRNRRVRRERSQSETVDPLFAPAALRGRKKEDQRSGQKTLSHTVSLKKS